MARMPGIRGLQGSWYVVPAGHHTLDGVGRQARCIKASDSGSIEMDSRIHGQGRKSTKGRAKNSLADVTRRFRKYRTFVQAQAVIPSGTVKENRRKWLEALPGKGSQILAQSLI